MNSPTSRNLKKLQEDGYTAQIVEKYNQFARRRIDLFNIIDIVAVNPIITGVLGIQCTTKANESIRYHKALQEPKLKIWLQAGNKFEIWGWGLAGKKGERKTYTFNIKKIELRELENVTN